MTKHFTLLLLVALMAGCSPVEYEDVSRVEPYAEFIGKTVVSKKKLILHGLTSGEYSANELEFYSFAKPPGSTHKYVKSRTYVPKGTRLEILAVEQCTNCYFNLEAKIKFRVAPQNLTTSYQLPVYLRDDLLVKEWGIEDKDTNYHHNLFAME